MAVDMTYYDLLEVPVGASDGDIKKAYRKLAIKWHPDKNVDTKEESEAMFKKIAEAYEVLSDPEQRALYNQVGIEGLAGGGAASASGGHGGNFHHFSNHHHFTDPFDLFRSFFGGHDPFQDFHADPFNQHFFQRSQSHGRPHSQQQQQQHSHHQHRHHNRHHDQRQPHHEQEQQQFRRQNTEPPNYHQQQQQQHQQRSRQNSVPNGFQDPFFSDPFMGMGMGGMMQTMMGGGGGGFGNFGGFGDFGGMGGGGQAGGSFTSFSSSNSTGGGGVGRSVSSQTVIVNGQRVTKTTTTVRHADGTVETNTEEHRDGESQQGGYLRGNQGQSAKFLNC